MPIYTHTHTCTHTLRYIYCIIDADEDRRVDLVEWVKGSFILKKVGVDLTEPVATFKEIDENGVWECILGCASWTSVVCVRYVHYLHDMYSI
jgi:hypothetical protein